jgi:hypothetical protein
MGETGKKAGMKRKLCGMVADGGLCWTVADRRMSISASLCALVCFWDWDGDSSWPWRFVTKCRGPPAVYMSSWDGDPPSQ